MKPKQGVTLVEMMIVVAIVGIIGLGLASLIRFAMTIWKTGATKIELQRYAQETMYWIDRDFKSSKASSIGNVSYNSGFEIPKDPNYPAGDPYGWDSPLPAGVTRIDASDPNLKSGFFGIKLANTGSDVTYDSKISSFPVTGDYILSCWIKPGGMAEVRLLQDTGIDFVPAVSTGCANASPFWQHFYINTTKNAGTRFKIRLANRAAGSITYFDDVCISSLNISFNAANPPGSYTYEKYANLKIDQYRLYYDTATQTLYRQAYSGSAWINQAPDPLCQYVQSITIKNYNQTNFAVRLVLSKSTEASKAEIFQLDDSITPLIP